MSTSSKSAFSLLNPTIQQQLYKMKWTELRPIQVEAIEAVVESQDHLIVSAMTAGGKTEAAFIPVLSQIVGSCTGSVRAMYVGPLKALINDQFRRLEELCELSDIAVHKWHGDVSQSAKSALLKKPSGVLLITPESVESLFINRPLSLQSMFGQLSFIVIDEMHSFIGTERGAHMKSLIARLSKFSSKPIRLIGLSATIGDLDAAKVWLCPREVERTRIITGEGGKSIKYLIRGYLRDHSLADAVNTKAVEEAPLETADDCRLVEDIIKAFYGKTALIFANSRARLEFYADMTKRTLESRLMPDRFRIHHGSLSKSEREDTEEALRSDSPNATFCSSTLELGIDVGNVTRVGQIGCPWSVSSLAQRLGRSGRRPGEASEMWVYVQEDQPSEKSELVDRLFPELLQSIAMTELMLEKWCEPPDMTRLHLSTLIQQAMSIIAERGGSTAKRLFADLIAYGAFVSVDQPTFLAVLKSMGNADLIEQTPDGELILGLKGERIVRSFDFYSAFASNEEMQVIHKGHRIGSVLASPSISADTYLILAGRRWKILDVDVDRREILVEPSKGGRLPYFSGSQGADIHPRVRQKMREVLLSETQPVYLDAKAKEMLLSARSAAKESSAAMTPFVSDGSNCIWFTWTGSRINRTLALIGKHVAGLDVIDSRIALTFNRADEHTIRAAYAQMLANPPDFFEVAMALPLGGQEKYDMFLSKELQASVFVRECLDVPGTLAAIRTVTSSGVD